MYEWAEEKYLRISFSYEEVSRVLALWGPTEEEGEQTSQMILDLNPGSATY